MSDPALTRIRDLIQEDVRSRGLRTHPADNLITACPNDFAAACRGGVWLRRVFSGDCA